MDDHIEPYLPVYCRPPNRLVRYEQRPFADRAGNRATLTIAVFQDKHGKEHEAVAQVRWADA